MIRYFDVRTRSFRAAVLVALLTLALSLVPTAGAEATGKELEPFHRVFERVNPCTGQDIVLVVDGWARVREDVTPSGRWHVQVHVHVDWTASDGFAGQAHQTLTLHERATDGSDFVGHSTVLWRGQDAAGRIIHSQERYIVVEHAGGYRVEIEHLGARCLRW
jgi:hypothetical protein